MEYLFTYFLLIFSKLFSLWLELVAAVAAASLIPVLLYLRTKYPQLDAFFTTRMQRLAFLENASKSTVSLVVCLLLFYVSFSVYEDLRKQTNEYKKENEVAIQEKDIAKHDLAICATSLQTTCPENADETKKHLSYLILKDTDKLAIINFLRNFKPPFNDRKDFEADVYYYDENVLSLRARSLIEALKLSNWSIIEKKGTRTDFSLPKGIRITWFEDPHNKEISQAARGLADILNRIGLPTHLDPQSQLIRELSFNSMIITIGD